MDLIQRLQWLIQSEPATKMIRPQDPSPSDEPKGRMVGPTPARHGLPTNGTRSGDESALTAKVADLQGWWQSHGSRLTCPDGLPESLTRAVQQIIAFFDPIDLNSKIKLIASRLKAIVEDSGLFLEKKIEALIHATSEKAVPPGRPQGAGHLRLPRMIKEDLKTQLLLFRELLAGQSDRQITANETIRRLGQWTRHHLAFIDDQQESFVKQWQTARWQLFSIHWLPLPAAFQKALLVVYRHRKRRTNVHAPQRMAILLELAHLGAVRSELTWLDHRLELVLTVKDADTAACFLEHLDLLKERLSGLFRDPLIQVRVSPTEDGSVKPSRGAGSETDSGARTMVDVKI
jgi:hypothetical protein